MLYPMYEFTQNISDMQTLKNDWLLIIRFVANVKCFHKYLYIYMIIPEITEYWSAMFVIN